MPSKKETIYVRLDNGIKIIGDKMVKVRALVNLSNYENMRIESSEFDDVEKCFQELEDAFERLNIHEAQHYNDSYIKTRKYKDKLGAFKAKFPQYFK